MEIADHSYADCSLITYTLVTMVLHNIPHHWKQTEEKLESMFVEDFEDSSDSEDSFDSEEIALIEFVSDESEIDYSIDEDVDEDNSEAEADSFEYHPLSEAEVENSTPLLHDVPDARRRLFYISTSDEDDDDDDGVAFLKD